jgi:hypothetical protein
MSSGWKGPHSPNASLMKKCHQDGFLRHPGASPEDMMTKTSLGWLSKGLRGPPQNVSLMFIRMAF